MNIEYLKQTFAVENMKFIQATFLEDGYEVRVRLIPSKDATEGIERDEEVRTNFKKLDELNFNGLVASETSIIGDIYSLILVPQSMEEMTDFIWKYVEKYGRRESVLADILNEAFCVLDKAVDGIPEELQVAKSEARANYEKFTSMIF